MYPGRWLVLASYALAAVSAAAVVAMALSGVPLGHYLRRLLDPAADDDRPTAT